MNFFESMSIYLLLASNAALTAAAALVILRFQKQRARLESFWRSPTGAALAGQQGEDIKRQLEDAALLDKRLTETQHAIQALAARESTSGPASERSLPIDNAVRMARQGATIADLTRSCGLNIGEARLMRKLHGKNRVKTDSEENRQQA